MDDAKTGMYNKYIVERVDGSSAKGRKHYSCNYWVLDMVHDPFARPAIAAYAEACKEDYPTLSKELKELVEST